MPAIFYSFWNAFIFQFQQLQVRQAVFHQEYALLLAVWSEIEGTFLGGGAQAGIILWETEGHLIFFLEKIFNCGEIHRS